MAKLSIPAMEDGAQVIPERLPRHGAFRNLVRSARPRRAGATFLAVSLLIGMLAVTTTLYTPCYALVVDGVEVGYVSGTAMVEQAVTQVEGQVSKILEKDYSLDVKVEYRPAVAPKEELLSHAQLSDELYQQTNDIKQAYVLTVDGVYLGAAEDKAVVDQVLEGLQEQYVTEDTQEVFFANEAKVTRRYIAAEDAFASEAELSEAITRGLTVETVYEVREETTVTDLAETHEMTAEELLALNPDLGHGETVEEGQVLAVSMEVPLLSVYTVDQVVYAQALEREVIEIGDDTMYEGDSVILDEGADGEAMITANVTSLNGEAIDEEILEETVIVEPQATLVAVGTMERPLYYSTGSLQWPCAGGISSTFGYRYIFGGTSFHSGLDIANPYGTAIYAADSGVVTFAGYKGSYGYLIIVNHGNGMETYYAHCSSMSVNVGDGVLKGDYIAASGSTGRATGNHCHFEVRIDGEAVNPQKYLP